MNTDLQKSLWHVAFLIPDLGGGGAERITVNLVNGFAAQGMQCDLILMKAEGTYLGDVDGRVRLLDLASVRARRSILPLIRYLRKERPRVLISALDQANVAAILAVKLARVETKVAVAVHITRSKAEENAVNRPKDIVLRNMMKVLYPRSDAVVTVSKGAAADLADRTGMPLEKIRVIYNPVVDDRLFKRAAEDPAHPWLEGGHRTILGIGRLTRQKNFDLLIKSFADVRDKYPGVKLLILGEGEERPALEALADRLGVSEDVRMPGFHPNPYACLSRASVFVLSSLWEALPTVLIEALALGTPIVSTDCPSGPGEILDGGRYGRLVPAGDAGALSRAILETLSGGPRPTVPADAWERFSIKSGVDRYMDLVGSLLRGDRPGGGA